MSENKSIPTLTLNPELKNQTAQEAAQAIEKFSEKAPAALGSAAQTVQKIPSPVEIPKASVSAGAVAAAKAINEVAKLEDSLNLTPEEKTYIDNFTKQIDVTNPDHVLLFGADAQKRIADFSDSALATVRTNDTGEVGDMLTRLVSEIRGFSSSAEKPKGLRAIGWNAKKAISDMTARFDKVESNVDVISTELEKHQIQLLKDVSLFDGLYDENTRYLKELTMYIIAGERKLAEIRSTELTKLQEKAAQSGDALDAQAANDLAADCDRFEKKLHDLKLTRQVAVQMAPQIRLLQNNDSLLVERIQSTLSNTLPLWKSQMVIALGMHRSQEALKAQRAVTDMTNELLVKNANALKTGTVETAKEAERGIIDLDTLVKTNQNLIDTIDEVMKIQNEGRAQRLEAERQMVAMEANLREKLLKM